MLRRGNEEASRLSFESWVDPLGVQGQGVDAEEGSRNAPPRVSLSARWPAEASDDGPLIWRNT